MSTLIYEKDSEFMPDSGLTREDVIDAIARAGKQAQSGANEVVLSIMGIELHMNILDNEIYVIA